MKKNDFIEVMINDIAFPNKGKGIVEDMPITVKNTIPGQKVMARITKKKNAPRRQSWSVLIDQLARRQYQPQHLVLYLFQAGLSKCTLKEVIFMGKRKVWISAQKEAAIPVRQTP